MTRKHLKNPIPSILLFAGLAFATGCDGLAEEAPRVMSLQAGSSGQGSPTATELLKSRIIQIASDNTTRLDNFDLVRAQLDPLVDQLEATYNSNRPANEVLLFQGAWKNLWFDDRDINQRDPYLLDRQNIYQVVYDSYYYNVANKSLSQSGQVIDTIHTFLKGEYRLTPAPAGSQGSQQQPSMAMLKFVANSKRSGLIPTTVPLVDYVSQVESGALSTTSIPGPIGVTGELWNVYLDGDLRISKGRQQGQPDKIDLYVLRRVSTAGP